MKAYSEDLRQKVVEALEQRGASKSEAARVFGISLSSVKRYTKLASQGEPLTPGRVVEDPNSRRGYRETSRRGQKEKACGYRQKEAPLPGELCWQDDERIHPKEAPQEDELQPKKGTWGRWNETSS
jgi:transposase